jgi:error-prone DNA polymerase
MGFSPPHVFTNAARRHDVEVRGPDVNLSAAKCTVEGGAVRIGFGYVQELGKAGAEAAVAAREEAGNFASLFDFVHRTGVRFRAVENLIRVGAFADLALNRRQLLWQLGLFGRGLQQGRLRTPPRQRQLQLALSTAQDQVYLPDLTTFERVAADYEILRLSPEDHPMSFERAFLQTGGLSSSEDLRAMQSVLSGWLLSTMSRPCRCRRERAGVEIWQRDLRHPEQPPQVVEDPRPLSRRMMVCSYEAHHCIFARRACRGLGARR